LGLRLNKHGGFETHGERMTSVNGVFACGNVRKPHGSLSDALADGEKAGVAAAAWASRSRKVTDPQDEVPLATS
jgi:thioredoxin reductase